MFTHPIIDGFCYFDQQQGREVAVLVSDSDIKIPDATRIRVYLLTHGPCSKCIDKIPCAIQVCMAPSTNHNICANVPPEESLRPAVVGGAEQILGPNCSLKNQYTEISI